jgi:hypothetical protein
MERVFILHHVSEFEGEEDAKLIGVYSSRPRAEAAVDRLKGMPGFREQPDGFQIEPYELDKDHWLEGFVTFVTIHIRLLDEGTEVWRPVEAKWLGGDTFLISPDNEVPTDETWEYQPGELVRCSHKSLSREAESLVAVANASRNDQ